MPKIRSRRMVRAAITLMLIGAPLAVASPAHAMLPDPHPGSHRQPGPCDIYAAATPCVAAHSTTRALYAAYKGPLYQVKRLADGATRNIGVDDGYADAGAQDAFCAGTTCFI